MMRIDKNENDRKKIFLKFYSELTRKSTKVPKVFSYKILKKIKNVIKERRNQKLKFTKK